MKTFFNGQRRPRSRARFLNALVVAGAVVALAGVAQGATYYVSPTGNGSGTLSSPMNLQKAADKVVAGDLVYLRGGRYSLPYLELKKSGTTDKPITFRRYQSETVTLDFGLQMSTAWTKHSGSIYKAKPAYQSGRQASHVQGVAVNGEPLVKKTSLSGMTNGSYYIDGSGQLFVWAKNNAAPSDVFIAAYSNTSPGIRTYDDANPSAFASYVVLDGLNIRAAKHGVEAKAPDGKVGQRLTIQNSDIRYTVMYATYLVNYNNVMINNVTVAKNDLWNFPRGIVNSKGSHWQVQIFGKNADYVTIQNSRIFDNHGEGVGPGPYSRGWKFLKNQIYDNYSVNLYVCGTEGDHVLDSNLIYNTSKYASASASDVRNMPYGILASNEPADQPDTAASSGGDPTPGIFNVTIMNNIIYNTYGGIETTSWGAKQAYYTGFFVANNTIGNLFTPSNQSPRAGIRIIRATNTTVANNISLGNISLASLPDGSAKSNGQTVNSTGIDAPNNMLGPNASLVITESSGAPVTDYGTIKADPMFCTSATGAHYYKLKSGSKAVNKSEPFSQVKFDYFGMSRGTSPYNIGASETMCQ